MGFWLSVRRRDTLAVMISFVGILSKCLPALLSGIPFASAQTWRTHQICAWTSISLVSVMIVVLICYMRIVRWPDLPVPPGSLAGSIYYLCDSRMLKDFERLSMLRRPERDRRVKRAARRYRVGWITGVSGQKRIACDYADGEQGVRMRSLFTVGFGVRGKMKPR